MATKQKKRRMKPLAFIKRYGRILLGGGISYTLGAVLFAIPRKWLHSVFHVFVVAGSVLQFFAFYWYAI